jgi:hypothetical protein
MIQPKFKGLIKNGVFLPDWPEQRDAYLQGLEGQEVEEVIGKPQEPKTNPQLRYFHGVICELASEASGYTKEEVKGLLKGQFLTKRIKSPTGDEIAWVPSLADMKKGDMAKFIDDCVMLCAKHWHCVIPPPDTISY